MSRSTSVRPVTPLRSNGLTVATLAAAKRLDESFLSQLGLRDNRYSGAAAVRIPYFGPSGEELAVRYRLSVDGQRRFAWRSGDKVTLYGLDRLADFRRLGWALLVEGESDCWTGWLHELPVLGIPGKSTWRSAWTPRLAGLDVYLWQEPEAVDLVERMARDLSGLRVIVAPEGMKDLSEAHLRGLDIPRLLEELRARALPADRLLHDREGGRCAMLRQQAAPLLECDDVLGAVERGIRGLGYGGDLRTALLVYVAATSRLLAMRHGAMPVHLLLVGPPSAGKSYTLQTDLRLLPPEAYHVIDPGSPRVLIYDDADLRHRALVFSEADSLPAGEDNPAASAIRNLLQDHRLSYKVTIRDVETGRFAVQEVTKDGPTVLLTTAVRRLGQQLDSRLFVLDVPDDHIQVQQALATQARLELLGPKDPDPALVAYQAYLQARAPWDVVVPFVEELASAIGTSLAAPRILRDFARLLSLIKAVAVLRHPRRRRDEQGRVVAEVEDYRAVRDLLGDMYQATTTGASERLRAAVEAVSRLKCEGESAVTVTRLGKAIGSNKMAASRLVGLAVKHGWLVNAEQRKGYPANLEVGEPLPSRAGLPEADALVSCNAVTAQTAGSSDGEVGEWTR